MIPRLHTLCFEAVEDGSGVAAGGGETGEPVDSAIEAPETTPAAPSVDFNSPEFQQAVQQYSQQYGMQAADERIAELVAQAQAEQEPQFELPEFDPTDPERYTEGLLGAIDQRFEQRLAPLTAAFEQQQIGEANQLADSMAAQQPEVAAIGEFLPEDKRDSVASTIRAFAEGFLPAASAQYGDGPQAVQAAMRAASAHTLEMYKAAHEAGKAAYKSEMENISNAAQTPGAQNAGTSVNPPARDEEAFALQWAQRNGSN